MNKALILSGKPLLTKKEEKALAAADVQVSASSKVDEGLLINGRGVYDVIVIDDSLRGDNIYNTCRKLRLASRAHIILLGNEPSWEIWEKSKDIGFDLYYKKPLSPQELAAKIKLATYELKYRGGQTAPVQGVPESTEKVKEAEPAAVKQAPPHAAAVPAGPAEIKCVTIPEPVKAPNNGADVWQDPRVAGLMSSLLNGRIKQISPEIDLCLADGFAYREADGVTGTAGKETVSLLESLAKEGLLLKQDFEKMLLTPGGSAQLVPVERCPQCDSPDLDRGQLIEHFNCGHIGLESEFMKGINQVCPKCKRELKLIGTDYRKPGVRYVCNSCHGIFPSPLIKCRCLKTGEVFRLEELRGITLYSYRLNEANKQRLEFELEPKRQLIDCLAHLGYEVNERVRVQGKSGATHTIDLVASIDDLITRHTVAVGILVAPPNAAEVSIESLFSFDSKVYDAGIDNKMVIAVPGFASDALKFAERQGIRVYRLEDLRALLSWKTQETEIIAVEKEQKHAVPDHTGPAGVSPRGWLKWLLENRGYHVAERLKVVGRSGAEHVLDLYAEKDDGIINHKLAACVIMNEEDTNGDVQEVMQFDTAAYDASIRDKIIIGVPGLSKEARQFADYQRIKVMEAKELADFSGGQDPGEQARLKSMEQRLVR